VGKFPELERAWLWLSGWIVAPMAASLAPMAVDHLFTQALGLASPWKVVSCDFDPAAKSLELVIDFERGARFPDPQSEEPSPVHDTV
jgi:hypothetical protein